jgi:signal transduction histidine kinase
MRTKLAIVGCAVLAAAGLAVGGAAAWLASNQPPDRPTQPGAALTLLVGLSLLGSGLGSWLARPENRLGPVMVLTAFAWFASQLTEASSPALYTFGTAVQYLFIAGFVYVLLSFPSGRLSGSIDQALVALAVAVGGGLQVLAMLFGNKVGLRCSMCPDNVLQTFHDNAVALRMLDWVRVLGGALLVTIIAIVASRWWRASAAQRREVAPVLVAGCVTLAALIATIVDDLAGNPLRSLPANVFFYTAAAVPVAVLVVFLRRHLARGLVAGLVVQLGEPQTPLNLREALARALGDPSLELAFWFPAESRYVSGHGGPVQLPGPGAGRRATFVERDGQPIAVLLHDPVLEHNAELVRSVCAAAGLALENERLQAELRARLAELQASRARLVEATDAERRRIERNLHDGTQQRLVSIGMSLGLLEAKLPAQSAEAQPLLHETRAALVLALQELRELTHGINPPLLTERGLAAALEELCRQAALPTRLQVALDERPSTQVETAAYFLSSEALANAAKHSHATEVSVSVSQDGDRLIVEVTDDGIGGATTLGGSGLRGLADRIEALGGRFTVSSPPGRGTTLHAEIPCA